MSEGILLFAMCDWTRSNHCRHFMDFGFFAMYVALTYGFAKIQIILRAKRDLERVVVITGSQN